MPRGGRSRVDDTSSNASSGNQQNIDDSVLKKTIELLVVNIQYTLKYYQELGNIKPLTRDIKEKLEHNLTRLSEEILELASIKLLDLPKSQLLPILNRIVACRDRMDSLAVEIYQRQGDLRWVPSYFNARPFESILSSGAGCTVNQAREEMIPSEGGISTVIGRFLAPALDPTLFSQPVTERSSKRPFIQLTLAGVFLFSKEPGFTAFTQQLNKYLQDILCGKGLGDFSIRLLPTQDELSSIQEATKVEVKRYFADTGLFEQVINNKVVLIPHWAVAYILQLAKFYPQDIEPAMEDFYDAQKLKERLPELIVNSYQELGTIYSSPTPNLSLSLYQTPNAADKTLTVHFTLPSINSVSCATTELPPILFLVDDSGSMQSNNRVTIARDILDNFYKQIPSCTEIALNSFDYNGRVLLPRTRKADLSYTKWMECLSNVTGKGSTVFVNAFNSLASHIKSGEDLSDMVVVLLTDGGTSETLSAFVSAMQSTFGGKKVPHIYPIGLRPDSASDITTVQSIANDSTIGKIGFQLIQQSSLEPQQTKGVVNQALEAIGKERQSITLCIRSGAFCASQVISLGTMIAGATKSVNVSISDIEDNKIDVEFLIGFMIYQKYVLKVSSAFDLSSDAMDDYFRPQYLACFRDAEAQIRMQNVAWEPSKNVGIIQSIIEKLAMIVSNYGMFTQTMLAEQINTDLRNFSNPELLHRDRYLKERFQALRITTSLPPSSSVHGAPVVYSGGRGGKITTYYTAVESASVAVASPVSIDPISDMLESNKGNPTLLFNQLQSHLEKYGKEGVVWQKDGSYTQVCVRQKTQEAFLLVITNEASLQQVIEWFAENSQTERIIYLLLTMVNDKRISFLHLNDINQRLFAREAAVDRLPLFNLGLIGGAYVDPTSTSSSKQPYYLNIGIKHFSSPYIYVDQEQNVHFMVPVANVGNTQIALDNTCQGLRAYKDWQANCLKSLEKARLHYCSLGLDSITKQIDYYSKILSGFLHGDFLTQSGKRKRDTYGFDLPPSIVRILERPMVNYVNLWLTPHVHWDNCCPFPDSVPAAFRMRDLSGGFPNILFNHLREYSNASGIINLPQLSGQNTSLNESMIIKIIDEYLVQNPTTPIKDQNGFEQLFRLIKEKVPSFNIDSSINLISWCRSPVAGLDLPETASEEEALGVLKQNIDDETPTGGKYTYIREDIESMIRYLAENRTDISALPSPLSGELDIKRLSIRIQLWLGMLSVFTYQNTARRFDLGQFISRNDYISSMLMVYIISFIDNPEPEKTLEECLVDFLELVDNGLPLDFRQALSAINLEEAKRIFAEAVFTVDQSQHYDNFQIYFDSFIGSHTRLGKFYKFLGQVSLPLETFFEQFSPEDILFDKRELFVKLLRDLQIKSLEQRSAQNTLERASFMQQIDVANLEVSALAEVLMTKTEERYIFESLEDGCCRAIRSREDFDNLYAEISAYDPKILIAFSKKFQLEDRYKDYSYYSFSPQQVLAMEFAFGGQYYFLDNSSSTVDRINQFFSCIPRVEVAENSQPGCYTLKVPVAQSRALSEQLSCLRTSLHLTPSIAATLYNAVEVAGKRCEIDGKNNQQVDYRQTKIYAALKALGLPVDTILSLEYSDMNGYTLKLKKHSPLASQVLEIYQRVISSHQLVGLVFNREQLLDLCRYLGFGAQTNITKDEFLEKLYQQVSSEQSFCIAEAVGHGSNFNIQLLESVACLWVKDVREVDQMVQEGLLLCLPQCSMEIICKQLEDLSVKSGITNKYRPS